MRPPGPHLLPYVLNHAAPGVHYMVQMDGVHHPLTLTPLLIKGLKIPDLTVHEALKANACCNGNGRGGVVVKYCRTVCNLGVNANVC